LSRAREPAQMGAVGADGEDVEGGAGEAREDNPSAARRVGGLAIGVLVRQWRRREPSLRAVKMRLLLSKAIRLPLGE
jgi:hypothetical protein